MIYHFFRNECTKLTCGNLPNFVPYVTFNNDNIINLLLERSSNSIHRSLAMNNLREHPDNLTVVFLRVFLGQVAVVGVPVLTRWAVTDDVQTATVKIEEK